MCIDYDFLLIIVKSPVLSSDTSNQLQEDESDVKQARESSSRMANTLTAGDSNGN